MTDEEKLERLRKARWHRREARFFARDVYKTDGNSRMLLFCFAMASLLVALQGGGDWFFALLGMLSWIVLGFDLLTYVRLRRLEKQ